MDETTPVRVGLWLSGDITIYMQRQEGIGPCQSISFNSYNRSQPKISTCYELTKLGHPPCPTCNMVGAGELLFNTLMERFRDGSFKGIQSQNL